MLVAPHADAYSHTGSGGSFLRHARSLKNTMETLQMNIRRVYHLDRTQLVGKLDYIIEDVQDYVEKSTFWLLGAFSLLYLAWMSLLAAQKPMWNDELYTYYIATLPNASDIWGALMSGAEQIPPIFHLTTRAAFYLFGVNHVSVRLPEIIGFLIMILCLFRFVTRRSSALYGFVAMLFPLVTRASAYAYEGRPYGIVLGFSGLALICWQSATENSQRTLSLVCLALSLAGALANHYYAILVFVAIGLGELVRSLSSRRLDLPIWAAFVVAAVVPVLLFLPMITQSRDYSATFWSKVNPSQVPNFYYSLLRPATPPLVAALFVTAVYAMTHPGTHPTRLDHESRRMPPLHELAVAFSFICIPIVGFLIARFVTSAFVDRYFLPAVLGFSMLVAFALYSLPRGRALIGTALVLFLAGWFILMQFQAFRMSSQDANYLHETIQILETEADHDLPIIASEPHIFMQLSYYAPVEVTSRLVYLADPEVSLRQLGHNSVDRGMLDMIKPWFHLRVEEYRPYIASHRRFLVYGNLNWLEWLVAQLRLDNMRVELKGQYGQDFLFLVSSTE
jgi:hypothetical protein